VASSAPRSSPQSFASGGAGSPSRSREARAAGGDGVGERERHDPEPERHHRQEPTPERAIVSVGVHPLDPRERSSWHGAVRAAKAV
jgi:hypothetical protein